MRFNINGCSIDTTAYEIRRGAEKLRAEPQVFDLLVLLLENKGRLVTKEEITERVWAGRIVSESAISSRIKSVRQLIGDDGASQRLIETVRRRGFRLVGDVKVEGEIARTSEADLPPADAIAGKSALERPVLAVLPFDNMSGDSTQDYFADGLTEDIISALSRHRWLSVVARNTMFGYRRISPDSQKLKQELGASYVVTGSVRRSGDRMRVRVQLVDANTSAHMWADSYDRDTEDLFNVQDEITDRIAARIEPEVGAAERQKALRKGRTKLKAWDCFHLGINHFYKFTARDNLEAQRLLDKSRELDPEFGEAHAWWAYAVVLGMVYWDNDPEESHLNEALLAARRALDIDDQNAVFHAILARVNLARRDYGAAIIGNQIAIRLNPGLAVAYCSLGDSLAYEERYDEAIEMLGRAASLSQNDPQRWAFLSYGAMALIFKGEYETALSWAEQASVLPNCQYWTTSHRAVALACLGRKEEAQQVVKSLLIEKPGFSCAFARRKLFYLKSQCQLDGYISGLRNAGVPEK
ncbi:MAG: winged helix-turn-helix domain-containing protein [Pseudomonadota bacterium]|nr:winged helix-turn-helix domain-containing protein [Pseudomonadota bacterium]